MFDLDSIPAADLSERQVTSLRGVLPRFGSVTGITSWDYASDCVRFAHNLDEATNVNQMVVDAVFAEMRTVNSERAEHSANLDASSVNAEQLNYLGILIETLQANDVAVNDLWDLAEETSTRGEFKVVLGKIRLRARRHGVNISREANADEVATANEVDDSTAAVLANLEV